MGASSSIYGMDVQAMLKVADSMDQGASEISRALSVLTKALSATTWMGPDHDKFTQEWEGQHVPALKKAVSDLQTVSSRVKTSAQMQAHASNN
ncbi:MAG: hypothetical protein FWF25_00845 [Propionibacteriaceae bacterium]|nr:hypothetical protein [Propionibacteriaceae bacterium]